MASSCPRARAGQRAAEAARRGGLCCFRFTRPHSGDSPEPQPFVRSGRQPKLPPGPRRGAGTGTHSQIPRLPWAPRLRPQLRPTTGPSLVLPASAVAPAQPSHPVTLRQRDREGQSPGSRAWRWSGWARPAGHSLLPQPSPHTEACVTWKPAVGGREGVQARLTGGCHSVPMATAAELVFQDRLRLGLSCQNTHCFWAGYLGDPGGKDVVGEGEGSGHGLRGQTAPQASS